MASANGVRRSTKGTWAAILAATFGFDPACSQHASVPAADEDAAVTVRSTPHQFKPGEESAGTLITATVYQPLTAPSLVAWRTVVVDEAGRAVRTMPGARLASPGEPLQIAQLWNGRDDRGGIVPMGTYRFSVRVRLAPAGAAAGPIDFERIADIGGAEEVSSAVASVRVTDTPSKGQDHRNAWTTPSAAPPPNEPGFPFNFYFGTLHTQTAFSDGGHPNDSTCASSTTHAATDFTPAQAYAYARNTAKLDFMGITDHNHLFDNACPGCPGATVIQRYHDGLAAAATASVDGAFVGIYGMEWGYISNSNFPNEGHVNLFEVPKLFGWESGFYEVYTDPAGAQYPAMYTTAKANPSAWGAIGAFNHPNTDVGGDFNKFGYTADGDDVIALAAIMSGPAVGYSVTEADTGYRYGGPNRASYIAYDVYNKILGAGFHVAPEADQDVHCSNYGLSTHDRTVVLATSLTKASIMDAIAKRRVYATSDHNAQIVFTLKDSAGATHYMGEGHSRTAGPVQTSGPVTLHVSHFDPDGDAVASIKIFEPVPGNAAGEATLVASGTGTPLDFTFTPAPGKHAYYAYVTQVDTNEIWSAPIWINESSAPPAPDFSLSASPASQTVTQGAGTSYAVNVTPSGGFTGAVTLSVAGLPTGATGAFSPNPTTATSTLSVTTAASTPAGTYPLTITGVSGSLTRTTSVSLVVTAAPVPDFSLSASPASQTVVQGAGTTYTATVTPSGGFTGAVTLSVSGLPAGAAGTFSPNPTTATSTLSVTTATTTPAGTYPLTITGVSGSLTRTTSVSLVVTAPTPGDFSLSITPTSRTVSNGASTTYTVNIARTGGFAGGITLSASGFPAGASGTFSPNPATAASSTLTVTTGAATPSGSFALTITGVSGTLRHTAAATLVMACTNGDCQN